MARGEDRHHEVNGTLTSMKGRKVIRVGLDISDIRPDLACYIIYL